MKIPKRIELFKDCEQELSYFVGGAKNNEEALKYFEIEYPEMKGVFLLPEIQEVSMYKCLDCGSYWVSDDVCGECGEFRLSRKGKEYYHLLKI